MSRATATFKFYDKDKTVIIKDVTTKEELINYLEFINYCNDADMNKIIESIKRDDMIDYTHDFEIFIH